MRGEYELLRLCLEAVASGEAKPLDSKQQLVRKLAVHYGASPSFISSETELFRLWLEAVAPGTVKPLDEQYRVVWNLAAHYGATPSYIDPYVTLLSKLYGVLLTPPTPQGYIIDESGNTLVDESGNKLVWF